MKRPASGRIVVSIFQIVLAGCSGSRATLPTAPTNATHTAAADLARATALDISPETATVRVGETESFSVFVVLGPGTPPSGPAPAWSSSDSSVATVDANGVVTAHAVGNTTIEVRFKGLAATRLISVTP